MSETNVIWKRSPFRHLCRATLTAHSGNWPGLLIVAVRSVKAPIGAWSRIFVDSNDGSAGQSVHSSCLSQWLVLAVHATKENYWEWKPTFAAWIIPSSSLSKSWLSIQQIIERPSHERRGKNVAFSVTLKMESMPALLLQYQSKLD